MIYLGWHFEGCNIDMVKVQLHDVSSVSNVGHLYDVTHHVAIAHMANDKCQVFNVGTGTHSAACQFFVPR